MNRLVLLILTALNSENKPLNSKELATRLASRGVDLSERTVRYYLKKLDADGLTEVCAKKGRKITAKGRQEITQGFVSERVGFIINKINNLAFLADFHPVTGRGKVILNITYIPEDRLEEALAILQSILHSPYAISERILIGRSGEIFGDCLVPEGLVAIGTLCSITLNSVLQRTGIPVTTKFGGIVEIQNNQPVGFSSVISYEGSSVPPLEILIKGKMTDVLSVLDLGTGKILGSFREIPAESLSDAKKVNEKLKKLGFQSCILFGQPGKSLLGLPVTDGKVGLVVIGGLNPSAALEEAGLVTDGQALAMLQDYVALSPIETFIKKKAVTRSPAISEYSPSREISQNFAYPPLL
ncbi:MAG: Ribonuclease R winged-helix domain protein [Syntrophus sp. PtaB.Bin001]|nr:MAG: Ribonuclease R winged-helix domain protein [Syntrophus sp. PtaB.Bin001]